MSVRRRIVWLFSAMLLSACAGRAEETPSACSRPRQTEVSVEVKFVELSDGLYQELDRGGVFGDPDKKKNPERDVVFLTDPQVFLLMKAIQSDGGTSVMQAPRMMMVNGQAGEFNLMESEFLVAEVEGEYRYNHPSYSLKTEFIPLGIRLLAHPIVSADRHFVQLHLDAKMNDLICHETPPYKITTRMQPEEGAGSDGQQVEFVQCAHQSQVNQLRVDRILMIPDGSTALLPGLTKTREGRNEYGPPILTKLPFIGRKFVTVGYGRETRHVLVLVTPRIQADPERKQKRGEKGTALPVPEASNE